MCYTLDADKIMFNFFFETCNKESISFAKFNELAENIVKGCRNGIIVRSYKVSVENAVAKYPEVLAISNQNREIIVLDRDYIKSNISRINKNIPKMVLKSINSSILNDSQYEF